MVISHLQKLFLLNLDYETCFGIIVNKNLPFKNVLKTFMLRFLKVNT